MHRPRTMYSVLSLLVALGLVLAPLSAHAGGARTGGKPAAKPLAPRTQKKAGEVFGATKATKAEQAKALTSLSHAMAKRADLRRSPNKQAAFVKASVTSQRSAKGRTAKKPAPKTTKPRTRAARRTNRTRTTRTTRSQSQAVAAEEAEPIDDGDGDDDFQDVIDAVDWDEATVEEVDRLFSAAEAHLDADGEPAEAADLQIYGHELMAYEAELAAQDYEDAGYPEQAKSIRQFGDMHTAKAQQLRAEFPMQAGQAARQDPRAQRATGFFAKIRANRAAKKTFKAMLREDGGMEARYKGLNYQKRSWKGGFFTGLSTAALLKTGTAIIAGTAGVATFVFAGLAAVGVTGAIVRETKVRDSSRKQMVRELYEATQNDPSNPQLSQDEIATYQAAGWI